MWTTSELIKALWLLRKSSPEEPEIWWDQHVFVVFCPKPPELMDVNTAWSLSELRWVYVREGEGIPPPPYWMLRRP